MRVKYPLLSQPFDSKTLTNQSGIMPLTDPTRQDKLTKGNESLDKQLFVSYT